MPPEESRLEFAKSAAQLERRTFEDWRTELQYMETLLNHRFNFYLVFLGILISAAAQCRELNHLIIVLAIGTVVCWMLSFAIFRANRKLNILIPRLHKYPTFPGT